MPLSGRLRGGGDHHRKGRGGPSKEDREVMDTGRIKRWREKREKVRTMMLYLVSCITYLSTDGLRLIFISSIYGFLLLSDNYRVSVPSCRIPGLS